jgi:cytochrome c-type biogenesis protein
MNLSVWTSFAAGLITFFTPCVLPLVPVYISLVTGFSIEELKQGLAKREVFELSLKLLVFIAGFSAIFVAMGATGAFVGQFFIRYKFYLIKIAGLAMILFGLYLLGILKIGFLASPLRLNPGTKKSGSYLSAFLFGIVFGFAWSPCSGPILGSIIMLASTAANVARGALYLFAYSLGIAIPMFLSGLLFTYFLNIFSRFKNILGWVDKIAGALLVLVGLLFLLGFQHLLYL